MTEEWRTILYPFGFLSGIAYGLRFLVQWIASEKEGKSIVVPLFWKLSITGNFLLFIHSVIQQHYPMALVQVVNAVLFWRNLNLMGPKKDQVSFQSVIWRMVLVAAATTLLFAYQGAWLEAPRTFRPVANVAWWTHILGIIGIISYSLRFWIQWWQAEIAATSELNNTFWILSLTGSIFSAIYFSMLGDWVNLIGPLVSFVPFGRNLWLIWRVKT